MKEITEPDVEAAYEHLRDAAIVETTPIEYSRSLSQMTGADVHLKFEHLQRTGSFKTRGAYNKLHQLAEVPDVEHVVAASAGNHAQGVALAATQVGLTSTIVMPRTAPQSKIEATRGYGADVVLEGTDFTQAAAHATDLADSDETVLVHAFDDPEIVAGQGTLGLELADQIPEVDTIVVPIGGGGLIAGVSAAVKSIDPTIRVVGVQAADAATVPSSLNKGEPQSVDSVDTVADGIATGGISELTLALIEEHVDEVVTVSDGAIARAILVLLERAKQLVEGAGAAPVAALLDGELDIEGETVVPILTGGNLDMATLQTILTHALTSRKQLVRLRIKIEDVPGEMHQLSGIISNQGGNIRTVHHFRSNGDLDVGEAHLVFLVETSGEEHASAIKNTVRDQGYVAHWVN